MFEIFLHNRHLEGSNIYQFITTVPQHTCAVVYVRTYINTQAHVQLRTYAHTYIHTTH